MKQEIRDATIALNEAETENAQTGIKLNKQRKMLLRQEIADGKEAAAAAKERAKEKAAAEEERLKAHKDVLAKIKQAEQDYADSLLSEQDREIVNVKRKYQALYDEAKKFNLDVTQLKANEAAEIARLEAKKVDLTREGLDKVDRLQITGIKKTKEFQELEKKGLQGVAESKERLYEIEKSIEDKKKKAQEDALSATAGTLGQLSKLLGEQTKAGKAAAIAEATIQTFLSAQKAYSSTIGIPVVGPVLAPINAGLAIAAGIKNIQAITAVKTPNGGGGGGSNVSNPFSGNMQTQAPSFNVVGNSGVNQLAQLQQAPVQAYVVSGQVTTAQSLDRNRIENATL
jgi:hypothetical protein